MKISKAKLDEHEIEILRELAQINCAGVCCEFCPFRIELSNGLKDCMVDIAVSCLKSNNINPYERVKKEKRENEQENN